jgi:hypothetical protein
MALATSQEASSTDDDLEPLHSDGWRLLAVFFMLTAFVQLLMLPVILFGLLWDRSFGNAAVTAGMLVFAVAALRLTWRSQTSIWMTDAGVEIGHEPISVPWHRVGEATPLLFGAGGLYTLSFTDGRANVRFFGSADSYLRLEHRKARAARHARSG